jgi:hypothetical protein
MVIWLWPDSMAAFLSVDSDCGFFGLWGLSICKRRNSLSLAPWVRLDEAWPNSGETRLRDITLGHVELEEISIALEAFKAEVAAGVSVGYIGGRLIKRDGS